LTLLELLLALALSSVLALALTFTFAAAMNLQKAQETSRATVDETDRTEQTITQIIRGAKISASATDTTTFFVGQDAGGSSDLGCDRLTLTTTAPGVPLASQDDADNDFETQQSQRGPVGGVAEISLSTTAVGGAGSRTGLFERIQRPSDGDPTQGGMESVLSANVSEIGFEFWNGTQWVSAWDTTTGDRRLPAAVQVSYRLKNDSQSQTRVFVVNIPESDVTAQNPDTQQAT
jgi:type II secretory pathway pseudopilin PulG